MLKKTSPFHDVGVPPRPTLELKSCPERNSNNERGRPTCLNQDIRPFYFFSVSVDVHSLRKQGSDYRPQELQVPHPPNQFGTVTESQCDSSTTMIRRRAFAASV